MCSAFNFSGEISRQFESVRHCGAREILLDCYSLPAFLLISLYHHHYQSGSVEKAKEEGEVEAKAAGIASPEEGAHNTTKFEESEERQG